MRPAWMEIDLAAFRANVARFCELAAPAEVCAVVKGNAYGHGAVECGRAALSAGASWLAVAMVGEARALRDAGIDAPILILGESSPEEAEEILAADATAMVATTEVADALSRAAVRIGRQAEIQIKIDSGMGRQGVRWDRVETFASQLAQLPGLRVTGLFTHFAAADTEPDFTHWQFATFLDACAKMEAFLGPVPFRHCCNTAAAILYPDMHLSMIRPGAGMYGISPGLSAEQMAGLRPVMSLRAKVAIVKELQPGDTAGYGRTWRAPGRRRIALLPLGYCDGYPRALSGVGQVLLRGRRVPIVGRISMDVTIIDVTEAGDVKVGEEAVLVGTQGGERITVEELAQASGTIVQEIVSRLSPRLPRVYVNAA
ncbi:MAG: alanine racemase [Armatimonadetes bacterium]|nr:alanine racemase [Armatimonadota bacterium]